MQAVYAACICFLKKLEKSRKKVLTKGEEDGNIDEFRFGTTFSKESSETNLENLKKELDKTETM